MRRCKLGRCWQIDEDICCRDCALYGKFGCEIDDQCKRSPENCGQVKIPDKGSKEEGNKC